MLKMSNFNKYAYLNHIVFLNNLGKSIIKYNLSTDLYTFIKNLFIRLIQ